MSNVKEFAVMFGLSMVGVVIGGTAGYGIHVGIDKAVNWGINRKLTKLKEKLAVTEQECIKAAFDVAYDAYSDNEIPFNSEWNNKTGYFDPLVHSKLSPEGISVSICPETNRRLLISSSDDHCLVIFERYSDTSSPVLKAQRWMKESSEASGKVRKIQTVSQVPVTMELIAQYFPVTE